MCRGNNCSNSNVFRKKPRGDQGRGGRHITKSGFKRFKNKRTIVTSELTISGLRSFPKSSVIITFVFHTQEGHPNHLWSLTTLRSSLLQAEPGPGSRLSRVCTSTRRTRLPFLKQTCTSAEPEHAHQWRCVSLTQRRCSQFSSVQSWLTLCDPTDCSTSGLPVHHQLPELAQTQVH